MKGAYIGLIIEHYKKDGRMGLTVENVLEGHNKNLKDEIDKISSKYIKVLSDIYGNDNVKIARGRTGLGI